MSKNKKGKVISIKPVQLSPEKYITSQARALPIAECLINTDWKTTGICNIVVVRRHKTGNLTMGIYLVDLYCLGVKDAIYQFNVYPEKYEEIKYTLPDPEVIDYALAHNIIYGAIAFAEDYGFKPHKDFAIAQYILEEDDENVELIEMDFGLDGIPTYMRGPYDDDAKINYITNTLLRTAGEGNFTVINDDEWDEEESDWDDEEFGDEDFYDTGEVNADELAEYLEQESVTAFNGYLKVFKKINKAYDKLVRPPQVKEILEQSPIGKNYKISKAEVEHEYSKFDNAEQEEEFNRLQNLVLNDDDYARVIKETRQAIKKYPGKPKFYNILQFAYVFNEQPDKADEAILEVYKLYPDYLFAKIYYANLLLSVGQPEAVLTVFNGKADLNGIYPDRKLFDTGEAAAYYACMCSYFTKVDNIDSADLYMNAIIKNNFIKTYGQTVLRTAIEELCNAKMERLTSITGDEE